MSADASVIAILNESWEGKGVVVLDGRDGTLRRVLGPRSEALLAVALSADGSRLLALRWCVAASSCTDKEPRLVETDLASGRERVLRVGRIPLAVPDEEAWALSYDAEAPGRVSLLTAPTFRFHHSGDAVPKAPLRLVALQEDTAPVRVAEWRLDEPALRGFLASGAIRVLPGGNLALAGTLGRPATPVQVTLHRDGAPPDVAELSGGEGLWYVPAASSDGRRFLAVQTRTENGGQRQDIVLLERGAAPAAPPRRLTHLAAAFAYHGAPHGSGSVAMSGDGRRAAAWAELLDGDDHRPVLRLIDVDTGPGRSLDLVATAGLGKTYYPVQFESEDLLRRLKALLDGGWLADPEIVGRTLGLRFPTGSAGAPRATFLRGEGALSPGGRGVTLGLAQTLRREGRTFAELKLDLGFAGPCLTAAKIMEVFGNDAEPDHMDTGIPPSPDAQPRWYLSYKRDAGHWAYFSLRKQHCASQVTLRQPRG